MFSTHRQAHWHLSPSCTHAEFIRKKSPVSLGSTDILSSKISEARLVDFKNLLLLEAELPINAEETTRLQRDGFCKLSETKKIALTTKGRQLIQSMGLTPKPMKRIKVTGSDAAELIDKIFEELQ